MRIILAFTFTLHGYRHVFGLFPKSAGRAAVVPLAMDNLPAFVGWWEIARTASTHWTVYALFRCDHVPGAGCSLPLRIGSSWYLAPSQWRERDADVFRNVSLSCGVWRRSAQSRCAASKWPEVRQRTGRRRRAQLMHHISAEPMQIIRTIDLPNWSRSDSVLFTCVRAGASVFG